MKKTLIFTFAFILLTSSFIKANMKDSVLIKHYCKVIEHGFFSFYKFDNKKIIKIVFGYSLNLKKRTSVVRLMEIDTIKVDSLTKIDTDGFSSSEEWNNKRIGTPVEKYFLLFHPKFLIWNNAQKLNFFIKTDQLHHKNVKAKEYK